MNILINRLQFWQFVHILPCEVESSRAEQIVIFSVWQTLNYWWWTRMKDCTDRSDFHIRRTAFHKTLVTAIWLSQSASAPRRVLHFHIRHTDICRSCGSYKHLIPFESTGIHSTVYSLFDYTLRYFRHRHVLASLLSSVFMCLKVLSYSSWS